MRRLAEGVRLGEGRRTSGALTTPTLLGRPIEGAVFDVNGVVLDVPHRMVWAESLDRLLHSSWRWMSRPVGFAAAWLDDDRYLTLVAGRPRREGAAAVLAALEIDDADGRLARQYADEKGRALTSLLRSSRVQAFPDARRMAAFLHGAGVRMAVASSSTHARKALGAVPSGVDGYGSMLDLFDVDLCEWKGPGKPSPDIYRAACAGLAVDPERCIVFEDSLPGLLAAGEAGCLTVGIARVGCRAAISGADAVVAELGEIELALADGGCAGVEGAGPPTAAQSSGAARRWPL